MLYYYNSQKDKNNYVYSLDMVRLRFELPKDDTRRKSVEDYFNTWRSDIEHYPPNFKPFKYRNLTEIDYGTGKLIIGWRFNGANTEDSLACFCEFNPNKIMSGDKAYQFQKDIQAITLNCVNVDVARFDLAVDVPYRRDMLALFNPTGKKYTLERYGENNKTEWLGVRNSDGFVKVYNKTLEAVVSQDGECLPDLTRIEVTSDSISSLHVMKLMPEVYVKPTQQTICTDVTMNKTMSVLCQVLQTVENPEYYINQLEKRQKEKAKSLVFSQTLKLDFDIKCVQAICLQAQAFARYILI